MAPPIESQHPATPVALLTETVGSWRGVSLLPDPERGVVFHLDDKAFGDLQSTGQVAVAVPAPVREVLIEEGTAHSRQGRSGDWIGMEMNSVEDVDQATLLVRLAYLYRRILRSRDPAALHRVRTELGQCALSESLRAVYDTMLTKRDAALPPLPSRPGPERS